MPIILPRRIRISMRGINAREQESLSRICRKLREGDVMKFVAEITHDDVED